MNKKLATIIPAIILMLYTWWWSYNHNICHGVVEHKCNVIGPWTARAIMLLSTGLFVWNANIKYDASKKNTKVQIVRDFQIAASISLLLWTNAWAFEWYSKLKNGVVYMIIWGMITIAVLGITTWMIT